jgi:uncharacterized membrane protein YeaQ/YmgE (transglycosylase-associated protein family)
MLGAIVSLLLSGLIIGALARFALPGKDPMPWWATILLGIAGSVVGGIAAAALGARSDDTGTYFVAALLGAMLLLYLYRRFVQKRPLTGPEARL